MRNYPKILFFACVASATLFLASCHRKSDTLENAADPVLLAETERLEAVERNIPAREDYTDTVFGIPVEMVYVEGGYFLMGYDPIRDTKGFGDEKPAHIVQLNSFYISRYEVTQELWEAVMGSNPSFFVQNGKLPVESVKWFDADEFCFRMTLITGRKYGLATEAQWEYAAGGGTKSERTPYSGSRIPALIAWCGQESTSPVGQMKPNELGIYDMSGNVWEWCRDWYGEYTADTLSNPRGPQAGFFKVIKGGAWGSKPTDCRISLRSGASPEDFASCVGLRIVMNGPIQPKRME